VSGSLYYGGADGSNSSGVSQQPDEGPAQHALSYCSCDHFHGFSTVLPKSNKYDAFKYLQRALGEHVVLKWYCTVSGNLFRGQGSSLRQRRCARAPWHRTLELFHGKQSEILDHTTIRTGSRETPVTIFKPSQTQALRGPERSGVVTCSPWREPAKSSELLPVLLAAFDVKPLCVSVVPPHDARAMRAHVVRTACCSNADFTTPRANDGFKNLSGSPHPSFQGTFLDL